MMKRSAVIVIVATLNASLLSSSAAATGPDRVDRPKIDWMVELVAGPGSSEGLDGLRILLTNDDSAQASDTVRGTDGRGLFELRRALCAAGADVVVVAPWAQQSGAGGRVTAPSLRPTPITVQPMTPPGAYAGDCDDAPSDGAIYGVCVAASPCTPGTQSASPSDAVLIGLDRIIPDHFWTGGPDVVLSGINFGQNTGQLVNHSGTVGAAVTAHEARVPAIAFSAEVSLTGLTATPFAATARFAVKLLRRLIETNALSHPTALNVNFPFVAAGERRRRPVLTVTGEATDISFDYTGDVPIQGGTYQLNIGAPTPEPRRRSDTTALRNNHIAITPLDGDWTTDHAGRRYERIVASHP